MGIVNFFDKYNKASRLPKNFLGMDSEEFFKKNLEVMPQDWHYRTKKISYITNTDSYRTKEFNTIDWENSIVLLGCSHTFGAGVAEDETISHYLSLLTNKEVINLGINGSSNELMMNNCAFIINNFKMPIAFIFGWTDVNRFIYYIGEKRYEIVPSIFNKTKKEKASDINEIYVNLIRKIYLSRAKDQNFLKKINYNYKLNVLAMLKNRAHFFDFSVMLDGAEAMKCKYFENKKNARDLDHMGRDNHEEIANYIFSEMKKAKLF